MTLPKLHRDERFVTTRTGERIHAQSPGSSVTRCGHWQRAAGSFFEVPAEQVNPRTLCENCFGDGYDNHREPMTREQRQGNGAERRQATDRKAEKLARQAERARKLVAKVEATGLDVTAMTYAEVYDLHFNSKLQPTVIAVLLDDWNEANGKRRLDTDPRERIREAQEAGVA